MYRALYVQVHQFYQVRQNQHQFYQVKTLKGIISNSPDTRANQNNTAIEVNRKQANI